MIGSSKNNRENNPRKCFWAQEKETGVKVAEHSFAGGQRSLEWRRKSSGTQKTISQNLLIKILWYLAEFLLLSYFK